MILLSKNSCHNADRSSELGSSCNSCIVSYTTLSRAAHAISIVMNHDSLTHMANLLGQSSDQR